MAGGSSAVTRRSSTPGPRLPRPPLFVVGLLAVESIAAILLFAAGVSPGDVMKWAGPFFVGLTLASLSPTVQELGRRQAKLSLAADQADDDAGLVTASVPRPWPVDTDRVVGNELAAARETLALRTDFIDMLGCVGSPLAIRPSEREHLRAREAFEQQLPDYELTLRAWLAEYSAAAQKRSQTFELSLRVHNVRGAAHAEAVTIVLELPASVIRAEERPTVLLPPERPKYRPPRARSLGFESAIDHPFAARVFPGTTPRLSLRESPWGIKDDGRRLEANAGDVHPGRSVEVGVPLLLLVDGPGRHEIGWTAYTKSARPAHGRLTLVIPPDADGPPIGRLHGIASYPDVPIVNDDGEVIHAVRTTDPPQRPAAGNDTGDVFGRMRQAHALMGWNALGLDPAADKADRAGVTHGIGDGTSRDPE